MKFDGLKKSLDGIKSEHKQQLKEAQVEGNYYAAEVKKIKKELAKKDIVFMAKTTALRENLKSAQEDVVRDFESKIKERVN